MAEMNYVFWSKNKGKNFKSDKFDTALKEFDAAYKQFAASTRTTTDPTLTKSSALATQAAAKKLEAEIPALKKAARPEDGKTILILIDYEKKLAGVQSSILATLKKLQTPSKPTGGRGG